MKFLCTAALFFLLTCAQAHVKRDDPPGSVLPTPTELPSYSPTASLTAATLSSNFQWQIYKKCPDTNRAIINSAWADSRELSDALASWIPNKSYQPAMDMYMGTRSTYTDLGDPPFNFPLQIQNTIKRQQGLYEGKSDYGNANLWVYCNEDSFWFHHCSDSTEAIVAYESEGWYFNNWYITFCPQFFSPLHTRDFKAWKAVLLGMKPPPTALEMYEGGLGKRTRAITFFHETMHLSQLVTSPQASDFDYEPLNVYNLARNKNTDTAVYNADSWAMTALAIWAQKTFSLKNPPKPSAYLSSTTQVKTNQSDVVSDALSDVLFIDSAGVVPQGASPVPPGQAYYVDPDIWEIQDPAGSQPAASNNTAIAHLQPTASITLTQPPHTVTHSQSSLPESTQTSSSSAYTKGTCSFHLTETQTCGNDDENLFGIIHLKDGAGNDIGDTITDDSDWNIGISINDVDGGYRFDSKLPHPLTITGEHENDYVQFVYGDVHWQSKTPNGGAYCNNGGWDPRDGPMCEERETLLDRNAVNQMDCFFPC